MSDKEKIKSIFHIVEGKKEYGILFLLLIFRMFNEHYCVQFCTNTFFGVLD